MDSQQLDYQGSETQETGSLNVPETRIVRFPFDRYVVEVELGPSDEFRGIAGVSLNRDFLSTAQRIASMRALGYHDVSEYYQQLEDE